MTVTFSIKRIGHQHLKVVTNVNQHQCNQKQFESHFLTHQRKFKSYVIISVENVLFDRF